MPLMFNYASLQMEWCLIAIARRKKICGRGNKCSICGTSSPPPICRSMVDGKSFTHQIDLGKYLVTKYQVRSVMDITSCRTCHR